MIRTLITPQQADMHLAIPPHYIGKQLEVLVYAVEEVSEAAAPEAPTMARFWGILSPESGQALQQSAEASRAEWDQPAS